MDRVLRKAPTAVVLACALWLVMPGAGASAAGSAGPDEEFHYHWRLGNIVGTVIGLFLPHQGDGELAFKMQRDGHLRGELLITSPQSREGEYWRYGSEIDPRTLQPIRVWSSFSWRGRSKSTSDEIDQKGVLDISCAIYTLRHEVFDRPRDMEIWSDGKVYPITVIPMADEVRTISNRNVETRHFAIRGRDLPERRKWTAKVDFWLAKDSAATPVEIQISRRLADLRLELSPISSAG
jgi:Protein of unknown function (DUF3108)